MSRQVSWFSELWPGSAFHWADLQHHPPPLAVTLGVGVHLGVVQGSSLISHRPRKPPLHQTWSWAQRDAPSGSWTLCKDLPELLTEAGSWKNTKKLKCFFSSPTVSVLYSFSAPSFCLSSFTSWLWKAVSKYISPCKKKAPMSSWPQSLLWNHTEYQMLILKNNCGHI